MAASDVVGRRFMRGAGDGMRDVQARCSLQDAERIHARQVSAEQAAAAQAAQRVDNNTADGALYPLEHSLSMHDNSDSKRYGSPGRLKAALWGKAKSKAQGDAEARQSLLGAGANKGLDTISVRRSIEVACTYAPYLERQAREIDVYRKHGDLSLKEFDFASLKGIVRNEEVEKLVAARPESVQAASRISGVNASTVVLLVARERKRREAREIEM